MSNTLHPKRASSREPPPPLVRNGTTEHAYLQANGMLDRHTLGSMGLSQSSQYNSKQSNQSSQPNANRSNQPNSNPSNQSNRGQ